MEVKRFSEAKTYEAPNHRNSRDCGCSAPRPGAPRDWLSAFLIFSLAAAPAPTLRRRRRSTSCLKAN